MLQENHTFDNYFGMLNPYRQNHGYDMGADGKTYSVDGIDDKMNGQTYDAVSKSTRSSATTTSRARRAHAVQVQEHLHRRCVFRVDARAIGDVSLGDCCSRRARSG